MTEHADAFNRAIKKKPMARKEDGKTAQLLALKKQGKNLREIGAAVGMSHEAVRTALQDAGQSTAGGRKGADITAEGFAGAVAANIRSLRSQKGAGVAELAEKAGMSVPAWYRYESGEALKEFGGKLDAIAAALGVDVSKLLPLKGIDGHVATLKKAGRTGKDPIGGRGKHSDHGAKNRRKPGQARV